MLAVSTYRKSQKLLDQVKIPYFLDFLQVLKYLKFPSSCGRVCGFYFTGTECIVFSKFGSMLSETQPKV